MITLATSTISRLSHATSHLSSVLSRQRDLLSRQGLATLDHRLLHSSVAAVRHLIKELTSPATSSFLSGYHVMWVGEAGEVAPMLTEAATMIADKGMKGNMKGGDWWEWEVGADWTVLYQYE